MLRILALILTVSLAIPGTCSVQESATVEKGENLEVIVREIATDVRVKSRVAIRTTQRKVGSVELIIPISKPAPISSQKIFLLHRSLLI